MSKRFTDTEIWDKEWFTNLPLKLKCITMFLYGKCDAAGVWSPNYTLASFFIGEKITEEEILSISDGTQFKRMDNGKIFIPGFIEFQYGKLSKDCKPHIPVYKLLEKHGIDVSFIKMSDTMGKTHNVGEKQKELVLFQDQYTCCYCGKEKEERNLVIDHVVSRKRGGTDKIDNLVACCVPCNQKKGAMSVEDFCLRNDLDFKIINQRVTHRLSNRVSNTLKEKEKDKDKEEEKEKEKDEGGVGETSDLVKKILQDFGFTETKNFDKLRLISTAIREIVSSGKLDYFGQQYRDYWIYKRTANEKTHNLQAFFGDPPGWDSANWSQKLKDQAKPTNDKPNRLDQIKNTHNAVLNKINAIAERHN